MRVKHMAKLSAETDVESRVNCEGIEIGCALERWDTQMNCVCL
jgi:hypothetical protein